ncbi:MAG: hypothetical protein BYD32DRAFT_231873 [Podila humilis]|nr:MAG: hypothetical protein BYD32DRAFT_231873 [Podila humilis]
MCTMWCVCVWFVCLLLLCAAVCDILLSRLSPERGGGVETIDEDHEGVDPHSTLRNLKDSRSFLLLTTQHFTLAVFRWCCCPDLKRIGPTYTPLCPSGRFSFCKPRNSSWERSLVYNQIPI